MRLSELAGKRICIWGMGTEGQAALEALVPRVSACWSVYSDKLLTEREMQILQEFSSVTYYRPDEFSALLENTDILIKSPGVPLYSPRMDIVRERGIEITSGSSIWFSERPAGVVIGVTGTKGKSTTSALLRHAISAAGSSCILAGNFGLPLISQLDEQGTAYWVVELSSYQLADLHAKIDIGILLNIFPEHLDWHGSEVQYRHDKLNIVRCVAAAGTLITTESLVETAKTICDRRVLPYNSSNSPYQLNEHAIAYEGKRFALSTAIFPGRHSLINLQAALAALDCLGFSIPAALDSLATFTPLPHRLTPVGTKNGIHFIDDSISTIPESSAAAVDSLAPRTCVLILGGFDRGRNWDSVIPALCVPSLRAVVCTGQNGERIKDSFTRYAGQGHTIPPILFESDFAAAVATACTVATSGDTVLLSPGSSSYDQFLSYIDRGNAFRQLTAEVPFPNLEAQTTSNQR